MFSTAHFIRDRDHRECEEGTKNICKAYYFVLVVWSEQIRNVVLESSPRKLNDKAIDSELILNVIIFYIELGSVDEKYIWLNSSHFIRNV